MTRERKMGTDPIFHTFARLAGKWGPSPFFS
jgi:hypothetical protein